MTGEPTIAPSRLAPAYVRMRRAAGLVRLGVTATVLGVVAGGFYASSTGRSPELWAIAGWIGVTLVFAVATCLWPPVEYRRTWFHADDSGIQIQTGVLWRRRISVPRSRVQHIGIASGPIERSFGLCRLLIYTAGASHSLVELPGLAYDDAVALRNHLLPHSAPDGV